MVYPELKNIDCPDLQPPDLPEDPSDCAVYFRTLVGPKDDVREAWFAFNVVTPSWLRRSADPTWGRGKLIVREFEWSAVAQAIAGLLARSARPTWPEVLEALDRELIASHASASKTDA
jgi:hypothetical protein